MNLLISSGAVIVAGAAGVSPEMFVERLSGLLCEYRLVETQADTLSGVIESIAADTDTFVLRTQDDATVTVTVTISDQTSYTLNGAEVSREEALVAKRHATVTHEAGIASRVDVVIEG